MKLDPKEIGLNDSIQICDKTFLLQIVLFNFFMLAQQFQ
jgi:hypothetical protein